jgi:hypothetical protein
MNRRTFNKLVGLGALVNLGLERSVAFAAPQNMPNRASHQTIPWPGQRYNRILVDTHVPDWDPRLMANYNAASFVETLAGAGFQVVMQYANSLAGLCLWRTKVGQIHTGMNGRDYFGETVRECHRRGLAVVAYYIVIYDDWAFKFHPDWRCAPEDGDAPIRSRRHAYVCPNTPYREYTVAALRELVGNYDFEGIFIDMTFWGTICYCPHCVTRFWKEEKAEAPRIVDWRDSTWRAFQKARERWMLEFANVITKTIKDVRPITVTHQFATVFHDWRAGQPLEIKDASDYLGGDFYGGPTQYSLVCKAYTGLTRERPFEIYTSRTSSLRDFATTKPPDELVISENVSTIHSAANMFIDSINPDGTIDPPIYEFLKKVVDQRTPYDPFLGGTLLADVAIYYDKKSMYDPAQNGVHVSEMEPSRAKQWQAPHLLAVVGAARILREAHIPYGVVTNVSLDQLKNYRAVIVPNVLEMTADEATQFRKFVEDGGVLYATGPSSIDNLNPEGPRFLLSDVLGVEYSGTLGTSWTYLTPRDEDVKKAIWPQPDLSFAGQMVKAKANADSQVLATVTLPWVEPDIGNTINMRYTQVHNDPPELTPGTAPGIVIHSFGRGRALWVACPIESSDQAVNAKLVVSLLHRVLPGPYHFEVETHPSVEMTLFHQEEKRRLLVGLLNLQQQLPPIPVGATVKVQIPSGRQVAKVVHLPQRGELRFEKVGSYVQFHLEPFGVLTMAVVEY